MWCPNYKQLFKNHRIKWKNLFFFSLKLANMIMIIFQKQRKKLFWSMFLPLMKNQRNWRSYLSLFIKNAYSNSTETFKAIKVRIIDIFDFWWQNNWRWKWFPLNNSEHWIFWENYWVYLVVHKKRICLDFFEYISEILASVMLYVDK